MNDRRPDTDDEILRTAAALAHEVPPARDLWPGIADAIAGQAPRAGGRRARPTGRVPRAVAQAAAVLLLIGASSGLTWLALEGGADDVPRDGPAQDLRFAPVAASFGGGYSLGPDFQDARSNLEARLEAELQQLPPATRGEVENNLATIRAAIAEINKALADEPDNVLLQQLLLKSYNQELRVMQNVDGLAHAVTRRTDI